MKVDVYDIETAEEFAHLETQEPKGWMVEYSGDAFFVKRKAADWLASLDGDSKVRFWKL